MADYVLTIRVATDAPPRDDINWDGIAHAFASLLFQARAQKTRPITVLGASMAQVDSAQTPTHHDSPAAARYPQPPTASPHATPEDQPSP